MAASLVFHKCLLFRLYSAHSGSRLVLGWLVRRVLFLWSTAFNHCSSRMLSWNLWNINPPTEPFLQCVFCINSIAHYLGSASYDDALSPRDHLLSAILTLGEGYHNFHHQFPMDYRNAFLWYQYDPTKWFIASCAMIGLASHLRTFPSNEISKGALSMKLKELQKVQESLIWPTSSEELPVVTWEICTSSGMCPRQS